jgi:putative transposase
MGEWCAGNPQPQSPELGGSEPSEHELLSLEPADEAPSRFNVTDAYSKLSMGNNRHFQIQLILELSEGSNERKCAVEALAGAEGVTPRAVYHWIKAFEAKGRKGFDRAVRADKGGRHLPPEAYQLIVQALVSNPLATSVSQIHRTLVRAVPDAMTREYGGRLRPISVGTVQSIKSQLLADPRTRLLFSDADARKEHLRTYAGQVFAAHANQLWQMDMTRCDVVVCDPTSGKIFRPRVHAIIDVYSGCIPGWAFAVEEDQTQTDLALLRAFVPKPEPYSTAWPVFGTPERLYWDNGKTYSSGHARRFMSELGVEVVYSRPRVSHTRGKIERFFGTLHSFEKTLPGYCGSNAKDRATEELRRVTKNTRRWLERSLRQDPGWGNRLLTLSEYQERVLAWLFIEYHDTIVNGKSRLMHFVDTVPTQRQPLYNREELMTALARQTVRKVNPDGSIRLNNRFWTVESGKLSHHVNREVVVLTNQFADAEEHLIAWRDRGNRLEIIGQAMPMPEHADSPEAQALRAASRAEAKRAQLEAAQQRKDLLNPHLVVSNALLAEAQAEYVIEPLPQTQMPMARFKALEKEVVPDDDFTRFLLEDTTYRPGMSPDEYLDANKERWEKRGPK